ncbi:MAG: hypothetical protein CM15mV98_090 [uncultured marine virus]|nr:MAG: hypothetical protein CM15mV98_090 [uncultured marine virus]
MSEWCQNKKCPQKKTQSQIRGNKGNKYYQSNKAKSYYFHMFCGQRCMDQWFHVHSQTCLNAVGEIDKQTIPVDDCWYVGIVGVITDTITRLKEVSIVIKVIILLIN